MPDISRFGGSAIDPISSDPRVHLAQILREVSPSRYEFLLPGWDGGRHRFGPVKGTPGMAVGERPYAIPTIDGEWFLIEPTFGGTSSPTPNPADLLVDELPTAVLGAEVYYNAGDGLRWHLVCDDPEATYPWAALGCTPLYAYVVGESDTTTATSFAAPTAGSAGPSIDVPLPGDYYYDFGYEAGGDIATMVIHMGIKPGSGSIIDSDAARTQPAGNNYLAAGQPAKKRRFNGLTAGASLLAQYKVNAGTANLRYRWLAVQPIRVAA